MTYFRDRGQRQSKKSKEETAKRISARRVKNLEADRSDDAQMRKVLKAQRQAWSSNLSSTAFNVKIPSDRDIQDLIQRRLSDYGIYVGADAFVGGSMGGADGGEVPRKPSVPYGFPEESGGFVNRFCIDVLRPFIQDDIPEYWDGYATNIVTTLMTDLFKKVLLIDASDIIIDLYNFFKSDGSLRRRETFGVELLYQINNLGTKTGLSLPWIKTFLGNPKYLDVKINWLFNTLSEFVNYPSQFISEIKIINGKVRLVHIELSPPIEIPIPNNFKMLDNQIIRERLKKKIHNRSGAEENLRPSEMTQSVLTTNNNRFGLPGGDDFVLSGLSGNILEQPRNQPVGMVAGGSRKKTSKKAKKNKKTKKLNKRKN